MKNFILVLISLILFVAGILLSILVKDVAPLVISSIILYRSIIKEVNYVRAYSSRRYLQ